jgi:hypothetical protein
MSPELLKRGGGYVDVINHSAEEILNCGDVYPPNVGISVGADVAKDPQHFSHLS